MTTTTTSPTNYREAMARIKTAVPTMEDRPQQDTAALAIEQAIQDSSILVCQAGTGVGKSNAALIPAITSGKRVVYSTATKVLQSQIVDKDLPFLQEHLGIDFTFASLKGWGSYICHAKLAENTDAVLRQAILDEFEANPEHVGDQDAVSVEVSSLQWRDLSIQSSECPGRKECPFGSVCKPQAARDRVLTANVAVVNHSLLATDAVVQDGTGGTFSLIGPADVLIVDEAHELEEFVSGALGDSFTEGGVRHLVSTLLAFSRRASVEAMLEGPIDHLSVAGSRLFASLKAGRLRQVEIIANVTEFEALYGGYAAVRLALADDGLLHSISKLDEETRKTVRLQRDRFMRQLQSKMDSLEAVMVAKDSELVRYVEETSRVVRGKRTTSLALKTTPVNISTWARESLWPLYDTTVLISATVLVDHSSRYLASRLGLGEANEYTTLDAGTPFDYKTQSRLYVPTHLPEPSGSTRNAWSTSMTEEILELVRASKGGALLLFTSNAQLRQAWDAIEHRIEFPCRRQGDDTTNKLMAWFRSEHDGVLFATRSFFTGASFEGDTCRLVVIDKLPFPVPTDPIYEARSEEIKARGGNDFAELSIPMMTLPLQQGFGRLIRTKADTGVVAILDPRLSTKGYGSKIVNSLPPATKVSKLADVTAFYQERTS